MPIYVVDDATGDRYVLMRAEEFEKIRSIVDDGDIEAMYPLLAEIEPDDWEDLSQYDRNP